MIIKDKPSKEDLLKILRKGSKVWNQWREDNSFTMIDLSGVKLDGDLGALNLSEVNLSDADLSYAILEGADFSEADLSRAKLDFARLNGANLDSSKLVKAHLRNTSLDNAVLDGANLTGAYLAGSYLRGADLRNTMLKEADLGGANLLAAKFNHVTNLLDANVEQCTIDRYTLEQLQNYGGLTIANRMAMKIKDGVAELRASYSGFWHWIHLASLLIFIFPYAWFIFEHWSIAQFIGTADTERITLWNALLRFIYNGGQHMEEGFVFGLSFLAFLYMAVYNCIRGALLWKTKQLELEQESSGLPLRFSLDGSRWGPTMQSAKIMFWAYLGIGLANTAHFFTQTIPLSSLS